MCGRFALTASPEEVAEILGLDRLEDFPPRFNIAPTQPVLMALNGPSGNREAVLVRWGLVPAWVKEPADFSLLLNARCETAADKAAFRNAMRHRRALIPASGFYEWHRPADRKAPRQAYWVRPRGGGIVAFAGLMETWAGKDGSEIDTGAILTTSASATIAAIHDRMPVVIPPEHFDRWLDCRNFTPREIADLLVPAGTDLFEAIPVSSKVNRIANTGPDVQEPMREEPPQATNVGRGAPRTNPSTAGEQLKLL